jgi:hypothetical protein
MIYYVILCKYNHLCKVVRKKCLFIIHWWQINYLEFTATVIEQRNQSKVQH